MPHVPYHPSALKRQRQNLKRRARNKAIKTRARHAVKRALRAIEGGDTQAAELAVRQAARELYKAASKGVLHKRTAARKLARLSKRLHQARLAAAAQQ